MFCTVLADCPYDVSYSFNAEGTELYVSAVFDISGQDEFIIDDFANSGSVTRYFDTSSGIIPQLSSSVVKEGAQITVSVTYELDPHADYTTKPQVSITVVFSKDWQNGWNLRSDAKTGYVTIEIPTQRTTISEVISS